MTHAPTAVGLTRPTIAMDPKLEGRLARLAAGRTLVIDYFRSNTCGGVIGDLAAHWRRERPADGFVALAAIEGVPIHVDARLIDVLTDAGPQLRPGGILRRGTPSIWLARPERWIEFLNAPVPLRSRSGGPASETSCPAGRPA